MRRRLAAYFDRRDCLHPDDLADETLNRVARRLEEVGSITDTPPARYCYIVAKFVFLEQLRKPRSSDVDIDRLPFISHGPHSASIGNEMEIVPDSRENLLDCLDACLQKLDPEDRLLILEYYQGEQRAKIEQRQSIAAKMGLTMNAVSIRACRIRSKLESCLRKCSTMS
jgi:DNA-directed RNA polymerase specialized sigma24 family protein